MIFQKYYFKNHVRNISKNLLQNIFGTNNPKVTFLKSKITILKIIKMLLKFMEITSEKLLPHSANFSLHPTI